MRWSMIMSVEVRSFNSEGDLHTETTTAGKTHTMKKWLWAIETVMERRLNELPWRVKGPLVCAPNHSLIITLYSPTQQSHWRIHSSLIHMNQGEVVTFRRVAGTQAIIKWRNISFSERHKGAAVPAAPWKNWILCSPQPPWRIRLKNGALQLSSAIWHRLLHCCLQVCFDWVKRRLGGRKEEVAVAVICIIHCAPLNPVRVLIYASLKECERTGRKIWERIYHLTISLEVTARPCLCWLYSVWELLTYNGYLFVVDSFPYEYPGSIICPLFQRWESIFGYSQLMKWS